MNILLIYREESFSPSSVDKDKAILDAVGKLLAADGHDVVCCKPEKLTAELLLGKDVVLSMARGEDVLMLLETAKAMVMNSPKGIRLCSRRSDLDKLLWENGIAIPPTDGPDGVWIKRGDGSAEIKDDVALCLSAEQERETMERMKTRGISCWVRQAHIKGDLVKFYGVEGAFFQHSYPTDTGHSKFGLEEANGKACHYEFSEESLRSEADRIAALTGVKVYGGDAIVKADGSFCIIDFNDWPTFSSCRKVAASAIAGIICHSERITHHTL